MMFLQKVVLAALSCACLSACNLINPAEPVPAYIYIPETTFTANYQTQGTSSARITDVWVFANDALVGAFELPALVPIIGSGSTKITISPGIMLNGISSTRAINNFFTNYTAIRNLIPARTDTLIPSLTYTTPINFAWLEDFDKVGISLLRSPTSASEVLRTNQAFEGTQAMLGVATQANRIWQAETSESFAIVRNKPNFLEINYKSNATLNIGAQILSGSVTQNIPYLSLKSSVDTLNKLIWKKIYVNLTPVVNAQPTNARYKIIFSTIHSESGARNDSVFIDNLKLVN